MSNRFSALKVDENPFKKVTGRKKKIVRESNVDASSDIFKERPKHPRCTGLRARVAGSELFGDKQNAKHEDTSSFHLDTDAFPELDTSSGGIKTTPKKVKVQLNFGGSLKRSLVMNSKGNHGDRISKLAISSNQKSKLSLRITKSIIERMEERESRMHFMLWYNNWQKDRNERMERGEKFYEPYDLEELDDGVDSDSDEDEMEETEYWSIGRVKGGRAYDN